jgi:hypothetical protein
MGGPDPILSGNCFLKTREPDWRRYLGEEKDPEARKRVIKATGSGHPCGSEDFVKMMEGIIGRRFLPRPAGRPRK